MKYFIITLYLFFTGFTVFSQTLSNPESVVYDIINSRYLVSNADRKGGMGQILCIDPASQALTYFKREGLTSPKGMTIISDAVYCTDITTVKGFNLNTTDLVFSVKIPEAKFLNDITSDGIFLYISDNVSNKIFSIDIESKEIKTLLNGQDLSNPNGILYDEDENRLLICSFKANSPIQSFDLGLNLLTLVTLTDLNQLDGITMDNKGNFYVSSWGDNTVYKFDHSFSEAPVEVSNGHYGPADIYYDKQNNILAIPNFSSNFVSMIDMGTNKNNLFPNPYEIKIYPNPTSGIFSIYYKVSKITPVKIQIINKSGKILYDNYQNEIQLTEFQKILIDSKSIGLTKGIYFIKLSLSDEIFMKRIAIIE